MMLLNNKQEVIFSFNLDDIFSKVLVFLIRRKAYKGYVCYNKLGNENATYHSYKEFCKMDDWKIKLSFKIYLEHLKDVENLPMSPSDRMLFKYILK